MYQLKNGSFNLREGSILEDLNGNKLTVIRFQDIFIVTTYGNGENWLVPSHLKYKKLIKYQSVKLLRRLRAGMWPRQVIIGSAQNIKIF